MSGGSFEYACFAVEEWSSFSKLDQVREIENYLRSNGEHEAADEVYQFILFIETVQRRLDVQTKRIKDILFAAEWWASGDWGADNFKSSFADWQTKYSI